ncbi:iron uptake transporter deferrochelatase/peroxidase subunit [Streptomyces qinglanensis]|uniref:Deferrochelatase n=1 Tax=Streptomyces qinglanensis TaxID=943816 RepID=A0A1H9SDI8_9ACTN|nr:deferrochelatase/peroxidase EfeB [Streptomyces qinglanensis]
MTAEEESNSTGQSPEAGSPDVPEPAARQEREAAAEPDPEPRPRDGQAETVGTRSSVGRRALLGWGGAGLALGAVAAGGTATALHNDEADAGSASAGQAVPFHGAHQAGISTAVPDRLHFAAFDVTTEDRDELIQLLKDWTTAAARMTAGHAVGEGAFGPVPESPPDDTGEAAGLKPSRLTLTVGFGSSLFDKDRFGLAEQRPEALVDLPAFPGDKLEKARSGGDLCVQACADDPQVAVHAIRNLARIAFGKAAIRWSQLGFGKTSSTTPDAQTPRNMFGFKDGTRNVSGSDKKALDEHVWVAEKEGPAWLAGGSYLVARRIRMHIETWDRTSLKEQEDIFGRDKREGAPVGKAKEHDEPFLKAMLPTSHVRLAHPDAHNGARILRRGYSFTDGTDGLGRLDAGLFFLAYQRDVRRGFIPIQRSLARHDALNEYIQHVGSALFAIPPGVRDKDDWWGRELFS